MSARGLAQIARSLHLAFDSNELKDVEKRFGDLIASVEAFEDSSVTGLDPSPLDLGAQPEPSPLRIQAPITGEVRGLRAGAGSIVDLPAAELARRIREGDLSPVEAVRVYLDRTSLLDRHLHAYITVAGDEALAAAMEAEQAVRRRRRLGPLHGVPIAIKDQFDTFGLRTTVGSRSLNRRIPEKDATAVARVRRAGAIILGKTNMTQFAFGSGDPYQFGHPPRNPWDLARDPYSSSTGSGIAVAGSLCALALGADTGGSIRAPASANGIVGVRPTWGRVSRAGLFPVSWSMDTAGPMARTVEDAALLLQVIAGPDSGDPLCSALPVPRYEAFLSPSLEGIRVGIIKELLDPRSCSPDIRAAVLEAARTLMSLGAVVEDLSVALVPRLGPVATLIAAVDAAAVHLPALRAHRKHYGSTLRHTLLAAALVPSAVYVKAMGVRALFRRAWVALFDQFDVLVAPAALRPVGKIGEARRNPVARAPSGTVSAPSALAPASLAGTPALSVPCGFDSNGMPIGLQILAGPYQEEVAFRVGFAYESVSPWRGRRPILDHLEARRPAPAP